ncbi:hypothetical protein DLH72_02790 [Candidatus Gracilibacteria bacterium]|nr:MAG: hypothetical protein DLH72_02790 [Candidatus Gracilibacteria bacterium]
MQKINLDELKKYEITLGLKEKRTYKYFYSEEDRFFYLNFLKNEEVKTENLIKIFEKLFKKNNKNVFIKKYDVFGLFNFFNSIFL